MFKYANILKDKFGSALYQGDNGIIRVIPRSALPDAIKLELKDRKYFDLISEINQTLVNDLINTRKIKFVGYLHFNDKRTGAFYNWTEKDSIIKNVIEYLSDMYSFDKLENKVHSWYNQKFNDDLDPEEINSLRKEYIDYNGHRSSVVDFDFDKY